MKNILNIVAVLAIAGTMHAQSLLVDPPIDPAQARVVRAAENAQGLRNAVIGGLRHSVDDLWSADHAANVATAEALGPKAAEFFTLFEAFRTSSRAILVQAGDTAGVAELDAIAARIPARTINADGTVTIHEPAPPAEE